MLTTRIVAGNDSAFSYVRIKYGNHTTDTVTGVIIYPDDFSFADAGAPMLQFGTYPVVEIEKADWEAFEAWGCVFLPSGASFRSGSASLNQTQYGSLSMYWSSSAINAAAAERTNFNIAGRSINMPTIEYLARYYGNYVRLAQDYK